MGCRIGPAILQKRLTAVLGLDVAGGKSLRSARIEAQLTAAGASTHLGSSSSSEAGDSTAFPLHAIPLRPWCPLQ